MKKSIVIFALVSITQFTINNVFGQAEQQSRDTSKIHKSKVIGLDGKTIEVIDEEPRFKGGDETQFISEHLKYPQEAVDNGTEGTVVISFVVSIDGKMSEMKILSKVPNGCTEEAIRILKLMDGMWIPGSINGHIVPDRKNFSIKFRVPKDE